MSLTRTFSVFAIALGLGVAPVSSWAETGEPEADDGAYRAGEDEPETYGSEASESPYDGDAGEPETYAPVIRLREPAPLTPALQAQLRDASIDRGFGSAHAETIGRDQWTFNSYELFLVGLTYGFTDDFQLSLTTLLPIVSDTPLLFALSPKLVIARSDTVVVAIRGNVWVGLQSGAALGLISAGPAIDVYLDKAGRFAFHSALTVGGVFGDGFGSGDGVAFGSGLLLNLDLGFSLGVSKSLKIILEGQIFGGYVDGGFRVANLGLLNYGVRFHTDTLAVDLAFIRPLGDFDVGFLVMGLPFVSFSYRW